ncbi:MAG: 3-oxoacyl-[acyl-carrier-protein] reductase [Alphaproteobacteria bacterium]|nr:3-oxoacyl-[acyl-carrier-protein] reductase [Alphaproteobacteria bacterium]MBN2675344.1 3-oxoacyl-[acyl-carrier-protein] reductase [Alphaproteobacteria bacterium]
MFSLKDKVALITGATGGIGIAIAKQMKEAGATVVVTGRSESKLNDEFDDSFIKIATDVSKEGAAEELIKKTIEKAGKIDILVNNAGITKDTLLMRMTDEQFDDVINTNLRSTFKLCRAVVMPMMKNKFGRIINMASIVGAIGGPGQANYAASKGGMIAMTKSIAAEVASRNITANCIAPGFIKTPMTDILTDELKAAYLAQIPAGRFGEPEDVASACAFLSTDEASYINGQTLHINGGMGRF